MTHVIEAFEKVLNTHPHIFSKLRIMWGTYECDAYIKSLFISDRQERAGFQPEIMQALLTIANFSAETADKREHFQDY